MKKLMCVLVFLAGCATAQPPAVNVRDGRGYCPLCHEWHEDAQMRWPAEHAWVVGVGATTLWDTRAPFSNQGYNTFKIGAPGMDLVTTYPGGYYAAVSGTSFSTPLVSGAVALMGKDAPRLDWSAATNLMRIGRYAEISDVVRSADHRYPQRIIVPSAVDLAAELERASIKQIKTFSENP